MEQLVRELETLVGKTGGSPRYITKPWAWERPWEQGHHQVDFSLVDEMQKLLVRFKNEVKTSEEVHPSSESTSAK